MLLMITFLFGCFEFSGLMVRKPYLIFIDMGVPFLIGPVIWCYIQSLTGNAKDSQGTRLLHLLPALLIYILFADIIFMNQDEKILVLRMTTADLGIRFQIENILQMIPVPAYIISGLISIRRYEKKIKSSCSSIENIRHLWLRRFLLSFLVYWTIIATGLMLNNEFGNSTGMVIFLSGWILFILFTGIYGIQHNRIVKAIELKILPVSESINSDDQPYNDKEVLIDNLKANKPFLDPDLHINDLAMSLDMHPYQLSRILNKRFNTSFFDFINKLRIEEFKAKIHDNEHKKYPILQIAYDSGFNSKTAFYRAFRKDTGMNPGEYIKTALA